MSDCCEVKQSARSCPRCGNRGKPVQHITLESLLIDPATISAGEWLFCKTPSCDVVYFSTGNRLYDKKALKVRVGIKETEDPIPLCYCFNWDRARIREQIKETGKSTVVESITKEVREGNCFCERSNPEGACCLGHVSQAVKEAFGA